MSLFIVRLRNPHFLIHEDGNSELPEKHLKLDILYRSYYRQTKYDLFILEDKMLTVTISPKYQVIIPKEIRKIMDLHPGEQVQVLSYDNRIEFIPVKHFKKTRGFLKGIDTAVKRDKDRL